MGKQKKLKFKHSNVLASSIVASDIVKDVNVPEIIGNYCINSEYIAIDRSEVIKNLLSEYCPTIEYIEKTQTLCLSDVDFENVFHNGINVIQDYSIKMQMPMNSAVQDIHDFTANKRILVYPTGVAKAYNVASNTCLIAGSAVNSFWVTASAQVSGLSGANLITASPISVIAVPTLFGIGFSYCECLSRGTSISPVCHFGARICLLPLKFFEIGLNSIILPIPSKLFGVRLVTNSSSIILNGFGVDHRLAASVYRKARKMAGSRLKEGLVNLFKNLTMAGK